MELSILIGGKAGQGTRLGGRIIGEAFNFLGYKIYIFEDYQSLIRGGHNFSEVLISKKEREARKEDLDFLLALDEKTILIHKKRLKKGGVLIFNSDSVSLKEGIGIEAESLVKKFGGKDVMVNTALVSALFKVLGIDWEIVEKVLKKAISHQLELNLKIGKEAFEKVSTILKVKSIKRNPSVLLTGNEATALGMKEAGLKFYFAYPMTPSTTILNFLARKKELGVKVLQPENEIAVINMALGVAFAGKRAAVGTSGGGFALMVEALSFAGQSETPILIVESQRAGPSTGMPTYNLQGDLSFVLSAGHGDFPRFVIAPSNAEECFFWAGTSLNLAWKYQVPAILLLDKDISESTFSFDEKNLKKIKEIKPILWKEKENYKRYKITKNGISPLAFPGERNIVVKSNSYEHNEFGLTIESEEVKIMQEKRWRKREIMTKEIEKLPAVKVYGNKKSKVALVSFGISKGASRVVAEKLNLKLIQPIVIEPFPKKQIQIALKGVKKVFTVELNISGQLAKVLEREGIKVDGKILKYTGRPFFPSEIEKELKNRLSF